MVCVAHPHLNRANRIVTLFAFSAHQVRKIASTQTSDRFARSHALLTLTVDQKVVVGGEQQSLTSSKLRLFDLAGNERSSHTGDAARWR